MKITDVSVTMFNWKSAPWRTGTGGFGGPRLLGVVTVHTDEGIEGHAFLGSSRQGADAYAGPLLEFVKPAIVGANPLDIGAIWQRMWKMNRSVSTNPGGLWRRSETLSVHGMDGIQDSPACRSP